MNLPQIPTDNLYKFICFLGLAILFLSAILYYQTKQSFFDHYQDTYQKFYIFGSVQDQLLYYQKSKDKILTENRVLSKMQKEEVASLEKNIRLTDEHLAELYSELNSSGGLLNSQGDEYVFKMKINSIVSIIGFVIFMCGAFFWYSKLQKYHDRLIKIKARDTFVSSIYGELWSYVCKLYGYIYTVMYGSDLREKSVASNKIDYYRNKIQEKNVFLVEEDRKIFLPFFDNEKIFSDTFKKLLEAFHEMDDFYDVENQEKDNGALFNEAIKNINELNEQLSQEKEELNQAFKNVEKQIHQKIKEVGNI